MQLRKITIATLLIFGMLSTSFAQSFSISTATYSHKKTSYIHLEDGTIVEGTIKDLDRKKGQVEEVKIENEAGKKVKIEPQDIKFMYLPPSGLDKLGQMNDFMNDATQWGTTDLDADILGKGHVYLEKSDLLYKKKKMTLMMQVANAEFCKKIRVYHDPLAKETASLGIGGITVAGGDAKSYYVKKDNEDRAWLLEKKDYADKFKSLFGDCPEVMKMYGKDIKWTEFPNAVYEYTKACQG